MTRERITKLLFFCMFPPNVVTQRMATLIAAVYVYMCIAALDFRNPVFRRRCEHGARAHPHHANQVLFQWNARAKERPTSRAPRSQCYRSEMV